MSEFAVTITCKLNEVLGDNRTTTIVLDTVYDNNINESSTMTLHPIVTGDQVADHIYNNPDSMTIRGTFSLNGSKGIVVNDAGINLLDMEEIFEKIKRNGIRCNIVKIHLSNSNEEKYSRFKQRNNMVLTNISWTEGINHLDFSFTFTQAMVVDIKTYDVISSDAFLPPINEPSPSNFTDVLLDWTEVDAIVYHQLDLHNLLSVDFKNAISSLGIGAATGAVASILAITALTAIGVATGPVGWIFLGAVLIGAVVASAITLLESAKYKVKQFEWYEDDKKNQAEVERFNNFVGQIHKNLELLNTNFQLFQISANEPQECLLSIDNNNYNFIFSWDNVQQCYSLNVKNLNEGNEPSVGNIPNITSTFTSIEQINSDNALFRAAESGSRIYLMQVINDEFTVIPEFENLTEETLNLFSKDKLEEYNEYIKAKAKADKNNLLNYYILVSRGKPEDLSNQIKDVIIKALTY